MTPENARTASGRVVLPVYSPKDCSGTDDVWSGYRAIASGAGMGRDGSWDMEVATGGEDRVDVNARCRQLVEDGATGLVIPVRTTVTNGERVAGADVPVVDSLDDMLELVRDIDIGAVSLTFDADRAAPVVFALVLAAAQRRGVSWSTLRGRAGYDLMADTYSSSSGTGTPEIYAGLSTELLRFCLGNAPNVTAVSVGAYRRSDAGATPTQELSEAMSAAVDWLERARAAGADVGLAASRVTLSVGAQGDLFEVAAKCRAARLVWARVLRERFAVVSEAACALRLQVRLSATTSTPGEPGADAVRVTFQLLAAAVGRVETVLAPADLFSRGTWPLRSQQVIGWESGLGGTVDPIGGSYYLERLTQDIADEVMASLADVLKVSRSPGAVESVGRFDTLVARALGGASVAEMWGDLLAGTPLAQPGGRHTGT